ncbi:MAG: hypothetical protein H7A38_06740 [Chlamydiales bacterium]|nr:hypothetical protein [Chlamydiales bacterium]
MILLRRIIDPSSSICLQIGLGIGFARFTRSADPSLPKGFFGGGRDGLALQLALRVILLRRIIDPSSSENDFSEEEGFEPPVP